MKINTNKTNSPAWKLFQSKVKPTTDLAHLEELAHNLWWVWNADALNLFKELDPALWSKSEHNPVMLIQNISPERAKEIQQDHTLTAKIKDVIDQFEQYISKPLDRSNPSVAYFSMEYGFTHVLKTYSGGLGILAGDYLKQASDSCIDITGVGLLYRNGYFTQSISSDGYQVAEYDVQNFNELPVERVLHENGRPMVLAVPFPGREVYANIWKINVGRIQLYLMDTNNEMNSEFDRPVTNQLYGGDWENRIKQEYLLGIGGILLLNKLGIKKDVYHCNEGHAAFINLQRLTDLVECQKLDFNAALEVVRASGLYTVHTPVPAGHDSFNEELLGKYMGSFPARLGISWQEFMDMGREHPGSNEKFSMSVFALNTCLQANGVSLLHGKVSREMFQPVWPGYYAEEIHVGHVTNGVHMPTWAAKESKKLFEETFGAGFYADQSNPDIWAKIQDVPDQKIWELRVRLKQMLMEYIARQMKSSFLKKQIPYSVAVPMASNFKKDALIVGFARRFATYKRAHLLFSDLDRLARLVNNEERPIRFIFAGKAHPNDGAGQDLIKYINEIARRPEFTGKIIFLENYDMRLAKRLVSGVDIWFNTPTRPQEASGTSGEKALMNGVLNFSVLDGWWYEGYRKEAGFYLSDEVNYTNPQYQDELDALTVYHVFENKILPTYFNRNAEGYSPEWIQFIKNSLQYIAPEYTTKRMLDDYINKYYQPLATRAKTIADNNFQKAKELVDWKIDTIDNYDKVTVESITFKNANGLELSAFPLLSDGNTITIEIILDKKDLKSDPGIDFVLTTHNAEKNEYVYHSSHEIPLTRKEGTKLHYKTAYLMTESGSFSYAFRMFPKHAEMSHRMDFAYVKWI